MCYGVSDKKSSRQIYHFWKDLYNQVWVVSAEDKMKAMPLYHF